jgi:hypothetical protein
VSISNGAVYEIARRRNILGAARAAERAAEVAKSLEERAIAVRVQLKSPACTFYGKLPVSSLNIRRTVVSRCAEKFGIFSYCWSFTAATD